MTFSQHLPYLSPKWDGVQRKPAPLMNEMASPAPIRTPADELNGQLAWQFDPPHFDSLCETRSRSTTGSGTGTSASSSRSHSRPSCPLQAIQVMAPRLVLVDDDVAAGDQGIAQPQREKANETTNLIAEIAKRQTRPPERMA